jgi:hypothetical protein
MVVTAWFTFIIFGLIILAYFNGGRLDRWSDYFFFIFCAFITAISAGVIWGGLFQ